MIVTGQASQTPTVNRIKINKGNIMYSIMPNNPVLEYEDDPEQLAIFEAKIARNEKIEATDWMPAMYRKQMTRLIHQHANSEIVGALPERAWIPHAPTFKRKLALTAKVQDEVGHAQLLYRAAESLGKPRDE